MKKNYTHISFVLDRSGSMDSIKDDTIGGFNEFIKKQKEEKGECTFSMIQFDNEYEILHSFKPIKEIPELNNETFVPRALTALYDALGRTIITTGDELKKLDEKDRPERVIFVILTDGYENSSREFSSDKIKEMIKHQNEKYNWQFVYLGANQDAFIVAGDMGIKTGNTLNFCANVSGVDNVYKTILKIMNKYRQMSSESYTNASTIDAFNQEDRNNQEEAKNS